MSISQSQPVTHASSGTVNVLGTGVEWIIDAYGCLSERLQDVDLLRAIVKRVIGELGLNIVGQPQVHQFDGPGGVTLLFMLSESHLTCHTYPEFGIATFNLYCCRERRTWDWTGSLKAELGAVGVSIRQIPRGVASANLDIDTARSLEDQR